MKNKIFPALMAGVLTLTVLTACGGGQAPQSEEKGSDLLAAIQAKGEIVVAMEGTWAPWTYHDETGELVGYDVEVAQAVAEELGILFSMCMILVCISCFIMFMDISVRLQDRFYRLIAFGLGVTYIFQVFLTVGGGTKFIPMTGVTLPFISYGGSSVLTTLVMFFIIEGLFIIRQEEGAKRVKRKKRKRPVQRERSRTEEQEEE